MDHRIDYIDIAKGIGILLVYIGHCNKGTPDISPIIEWIYAFHMPLFFFVSGLLFPCVKIQMSTFYRNKFASLVIPYMIFSVIHYVIRKLFHLPAGAIGILLHGWGSNALWFIPVLLLANMAHYHLVYGSSVEKVITLLILTICLIWKVHTNSWAPYNISELPWFYFCFVSGFLLKELVQRMESFKNPWIFGIIGLIIMTLFVFLIAYPYNDDYRHQDNDYICWTMRYVVGLLGTLSTLLLSMSFSQVSSMKRFLSWFGRNSLVILCTHQLFYTVLQTVNYQPIFRGGYNHLIIWCLVFASIWLYNKYISIIIKKIHT